MQVSILYLGLTSRKFCSTQISVFFSKLIKLGFIAVLLRYNSYVYRFHVFLPASPPPPPAMVGTAECKFSG